MGLWYVKDRNEGWDPVVRKRRSDSSCELDLEEDNVCAEKDFWNFLIYGMNTRK